MNLFVYIEVMHERSYFMPHLDQNSDIAPIGKFRIHSLTICKHYFNYSKTISIKWNNKQRFWYILDLCKLCLGWSNE